jgi:hypothetical protein
MRAEPLVRWAPRGADFEGFDGQLFELFTAVREAITDGRPAVLLVLEDDLLGHGSVTDAAMATATVGLARALATEGQREGWKINVIAVPRDDFDANWMQWAHRLSDPEGASGAVVNLGSLHLGRVPV